MNGTRIEQLLARGYTPDRILREIPDATMRQIENAEARIDISRRVVDGRIAYCTRMHDLRTEGATGAKGECMECKRERARQRARNVPEGEKVRFVRPKHCRNCSRPMRDRRHAPKQDAVVHKGRGFCGNCYDRYAHLEAA